MLSKKYYIGQSTDSCVCYSSSSGGIGTAITQYLLSSNQYKTSITLIFDKLKCCYAPRLIKSVYEVNICGSVYQDIDLVSFIRENIDIIKESIVLTCLPCQVKPLRAIFNRNGIKSFIMTFACSGQTTIEGTYCYYNFLNIKKRDIAHMQYRGNGWPSGIQILLNNGEKIYRENYTEPWVTIHQSKLFRPKRCFFCKMDTDYSSEISLSDPWIERFTKSDKVGHTLFVVNTKLGNKIIHDMKNLNKVSLMPSDLDDWNIAQKTNISKKFTVESSISSLKTISKLCNNRYYQNLFSLNLFFMKIHLYIMRLIYKINNISKR